VLPDWEYLEIDTLDDRWWDSAGHRGVFPSKTMLLDLLTVRGEQGEFAAMQQGLRKLFGVTGETWELVEFGIDASAGTGRFRYGRPKR
jgi:hypothetical protein